MGFKYDNFLKEGLEVQKRFEKSISMECGGHCEPATEEEDITLHVDTWWFTDKGQKIGIDVKGLKKDKRSDSFANPDIHWIELKNVNGKPGWIYGEEDYVAFESMDSWILITPKRLLDIIDKNVTNKEITNSNTETFRYYQREGRKDVIVKVPTSYIIEKANKLIQK